MKKLLLVLAVVFCAMCAFAVLPSPGISAEEPQATEGSKEKPSFEEQLQNLDELWPADEPQATVKNETAEESSAAEEVQATEEAQPAQEPAVTQESQATEEPAVTPEVTATEEPAATEVTQSTEEPKVTEESPAAEQPQITEEPQPEKTSEEGLTTGPAEIIVPAQAVAEPVISKGLSAKELRKSMDKAKMYRRQGKNKRAIASLTRVIEANPPQETLGEAYFLRGLVYRRMKNIDKVQADWQEAQSLGVKLEEGKVLRGKKQGLYTWYSPEGGILSQTNYVNNQLNGRSVKFYSNGQISHKGFYRAGKLDGPFTWFTPNGKISEKGTFKNGLRNGVFYRYYENGKLKQRVPYKKGLKNGTALLYKENGRLDKKVYFEDGQYI